MQAGHHGYVHIVGGSTPWWWNPPGLEDGEWHEWLNAVQGMEPVERAHRLASAAASRLALGTRMLEIRCGVHDVPIAEVLDTPHGLLWRSQLSDPPRGPLIRQVDLLDFNAFVPTLRAWCSGGGRIKTFESRRIRALVDATRDRAPTSAEPSAPTRRCYFCDSPVDGARWTCRSHSAVEAFALARAEGVLASRPRPSARNAEDWADVVMKWSVSDEGRSYKVDAERYWPSDVDDQARVPLRALALGLTVQMVEQRYVSDSAGFDDSRQPSDVDGAVLVADCASGIGEWCST